MTINSNEDARSLFTRDVVFKKLKAKGEKRKIKIDRNLVLYCEISKRKLLL